MIPSNVEQVKRAQWRAARKRWRLKHREKDLANKRRYRAQNRDKCLSYNRKYRAKNKLRIKAYDKEYKQRIQKDPVLHAEKLARYRQYYRKSGDRLRKRARIYYLKNRPHILAKRRLLYEIKKEDAEFDWSCEAGCGRKTYSPTGLCRKCSTVECKKCGKPLIQKVIGQRVHEACRPKESKRL